MMDPTQNPDGDLQGEQVPSSGEVNPAEKLVAASLEADLRPPLPRQRPIRRRIRTPLILFILTCLSTFLAGASNWMPPYYLSDLMALRRTIVIHWQDGLTYMAAVLAILLTHELGHFFATIRHGVPASFPYFLPFPISPIGTFGAVIGMDGMRADRKQLFDIGIAGPIAGLVVAVPISWIGIQSMDFSQPARGPLVLDIPLAIRWGLNYLQPTGYSSEIQFIGFNQMNPFFWAGWVGLLVTGLNMLPVGQFDGGHVTYTLFGKRAWWIARGFLVLAIAYAIYNMITPLFFMIGLFLLVGPDHPRTRNDRVPLGRFRLLLGWASLAIPLLCLAPRLIIEQ